MQNCSKAVETASATCTSLFTNKLSSSSARSALCDYEECYGAKTEEQYKQQFERKLYNDQIKAMKSSQGQRFDPSSTKQLFLDYKMLDSQVNSEYSSTLTPCEDPLDSTNAFSRYKKKFSSFKSSIKLSGLKPDNQDFANGFKAQSAQSMNDESNLPRIQIPPVDELWNFKYSSASVVKSPDMLVFQKDYSYSEKN